MSPAVAGADAAAAAANLDGVLDSWATAGGASVPNREVVPRGGGAQGGPAGLARMMFQMFSANNLTLSPATERRCHPGLATATMAAAGASPTHSGRTYRPTSGSVYQRSHKPKTFYYKRSTRRNSPHRVPRPPNRLLMREATPGITVAAVRTATHSAASGRPSEHPDEERRH